MDEFIKISKVQLYIDLKIILSDYQSNYVKRLEIDNNGWPRAMFKQLTFLFKKFNMKTIMSQFQDLQNTFKQFLIEISLQFL